jgi:hypothetical protein
MRRVSLLLALTIPMLGSGEDFSADTPTVLRAQVGGSAVVATVVTRMVNTTDVIPRPAPGQYGQRVKVIKDLQLRVNGREVFVPLSVYASLVDARAGELQQAGPFYRFIVRGGDASESYRALIDFDAQRVKRCAIYVAESPNRPVEETIYNTIVVE